MEDFQRQIERANQIATLLGYLAPRLEPHRVLLLVDYLGDLVDPWVAAFLKPHFLLAEDGDLTPGMQALAARLETPGLRAGLDLEVASMESEEVLSVGSGVEDAITDTVFGATPIHEAVEALLRGCNDPEHYVLFHMQWTLPYDLKFLPRRAVSQASVFLRAAEERIPGLHTLRYDLVNVLCQAHLKLCRFDSCVEEVDRLLRSSAELSRQERSYLEAYRGIALAGLGEISQARDALRKAMHEGLSIADEDPSALCFALCEIYRLGLSTGDMSDLPEAGDLLRQNLDQCQAINVRYTAVGFFAICQSQLGEGRAAEGNSRAAIKAARTSRALDVEIDVRNLRAHLLLMQGRRKEAADLLVESLPLLTLSDHPLAAAQTEALIHQTASREAPQLPEGPPVDWQESLPAGQRRPFLDEIHVAAGLARQRSFVDRDEGARQLVPAIRGCEEVRRLIPEKQIRRFLVHFLEVYRLFLDLPAYGHMPGEEHAAILRALIPLLESEGIERDEYLARALLQLHYARASRKPEGADLISALILETVLDPDHGDLHRELAEAGRQADDPSQALDLGPDEPREAATGGEAPARGGISNPESYRNCDRCGRSVYDLSSGLEPGKQIGLIDGSMALISGSPCERCGGFFCIYPCTLRGDEPFLRLCPECRFVMLGVLDAG